MELISNDFSDGDYLAFEHVLAEEFGFGRVTIAKLGEISRYVDGSRVQFQRHR